MLGWPEWSGLCEDDVGADIIRPSKAPLSEEAKAARTP